jgi:hypothetical protein
MHLPRQRLRALALLIVVGAVAGCSLNTEVVGVGQVSTFAGDNQSQPVNTLLPQPLQVLVVSQLGQPMENVEVSWSIAAGGGSLSANVTLTDANGIASVSYTTGPTPGHAVIVAQVNGVEPLSFDETIT